MRSCLIAAFSILSCCLSGASTLEAQTLKVGGTGAAAGVLQRLVVSFSAIPPHHHVEVINGLGSAGAIAAVAAGVLDLAISSREPSSMEKAQGVQSQLFFETPYIFVSSSSAPLSLSIDEVVGYYAGTKRTYPNGSAVRLVLRPRNDSNTLYVTKAVPGMSAAQDKARLRHDLPVAGTDQDNMLHLKSVEGAFSGMTLTQLVTEPNSLQRVHLDGVEGTLQTIASGAYPYKMSIYVVTGKAPNAVAKAFQAFLASSEAQAIIHTAGGKMRVP